MNRKKMTLTFSADVIDALRDQGEARGFVSPQLYARHLITTGLQLINTSSGIAEIFNDILDEVRKLRREVEHGQQAE